MHANKIYLLLVHDCLFYLSKLLLCFFLLKLFILIFINFFRIDGKYLVLPSGELHIKDVGPEDGYKTYQCRTKHRLTGETRLSATKGRLVITGTFSIKFLHHTYIFFINVTFISIVIFSSGFVINNCFSHN